MKSTKSLSSIARLFAVFTTVLILQFQNTMYAQTDSGSEMSAPEQVKIAGTQVLHLKSQIVDQDYNLLINLPANYDKEPDKKYPVIYLLDAQWDFPLLNAIYGQQYYDGFIPELIVVGITWGGKDPNPDLLRARDFTPTSIQGQSTPTGGAKKFISFIRQELIPFIDSKFRTQENERTLMGSSLGGLFTLYALFNDNDLFDYYVLTSPAVTSGNGSLFNDEKSYAEHNSTLNARVFIGIGEFENPTAYNRFLDQIKSHNYKGLHLESKILKHLGHSGGKSDGYPSGLQFVFAKPSLTLDESVLKQYVGSYSVMNQYVIKISIENGKLIGLAPGEGKISLEAASDKDFYHLGSFLKVHFEKDDSGKVTGFQLEQYQNKTEFKKAE